MKSTDQLNPILQEALRRFSIAQKDHWKLFRGVDINLYGQPVDAEKCDLKRYQDLFIYSFIQSYVPRGARILEVGGGDSRILKRIHRDYECWNVDKLEGQGNGPTAIGDRPWRLVRDYIGQFNPNLPENYFDLVFSISVLEHVPEDRPHAYGRILDDIDRILKPGGLSLHCIDVVFKPDGPWAHPIIDHIIATRSTFEVPPNLEDVESDPDVYCMTRRGYESSWQKHTQKSYEEFGRPTSIQLLWQKATLRPDQVKVPIVRSKKELPKISIVTPSYNQAAYLEECIDSILGQGYPNLEYVIMDGGSTDGSVDIIKKYEHHLTYWRSAPDQGQYQAIQEGFSRTTGEIMAWLNSDDKYHAHSLWLAAAVFKAFPEIRWLTGRPTVWGASGELEFVMDPLPQWSRADYLSGNYGPPHIQQESTFWRRDLWNQAGGGFHAGMNYAGDLELWTRFFRHSQLHVADLLLGGFRKQPDSKTATAMQAYEQEAAEVIRQELVWTRSRRESVLDAPPPVTMHALHEATRGLEGFVSPESISAALTDLIRQTGSEYVRSRLIRVQEDLFDALISRCRIEEGTYRRRNYQVTAVVSTYKSEAFMQECLSDLTQQTLGKQLEIIVVDADSPENEEAVVRRFQAEHDNIRYVRCPTRNGVYAAWNIGLRLARGISVTPFSTNDRLRPDAYELLHGALGQRPDVALVYGDTYVTDEPHQEWGKHTPSRVFPQNFVWGDFSYQELLNRSLVGPHPMWRRWVHGRVGYFDEGYTAMADQEFWLRLGEHFQLQHIPEFTGLYWLAEDALSNHAKSDLPIKEKEHIRAIYRERSHLRRVPQASVSIIIQSTTRLPIPSDAFRCSLQCSRFPTTKWL